MNNFEIKRLGIDTLEDQVTVFLASFALEKDRDRMREDWVNKHYKNPRGNSVVFGAYDGALLVGINAFMPMQYQYQGKIVSVVQSCESGVLPSHRRKGIWAQIISFAMESFRQEQQVDFMIGFPNFNNSFYGFLKLGWETPCDVTNYLMVNNGREISKNFLKSDSGLSMAKLAEIQKSYISLASLKWRKCVVDSDSSEAYGWSAPTQHEGFILSTTPEFLEWKKQYRQMQTCILKKDGNILGRAFYTINPYGRVDMIRLMRIDVANQKLQKQITAALLHHISQKHRDAAFIRLWLSAENSMLPIYKSLGFLKAKHRNPYICYVLKEDVVSRDIVLNPLLWQPSFLDLD